MMKKTWMGVAALALMSGCVSGQYIVDDQVSASREINPVQGADGNYIGSFAVRRPFTDVTPSQIEQCIASTVQQRQITLTSGALRNPAGQGDNMAFNGIAGDGNGDVSGITGVTSHEGRDLAYRLEIQRLPEANYYYFDRLGDTSAGQGSEFAPIGAWAEAAPMQAAQGLEAVADQMQSCLTQGAANTPGEDPTGWQPPS